jgi:hypothetical protein
MVLCGAIERTPAVAGGAVALNIFEVRPRLRQAMGAEAHGTDFHGDA